MEKNKKLTIITTHINADYDALASMLAAQKLYPGSILVFPRFNEKNLRNFFIQSMGYLFNMADIKNINFDRIERLVLVDTRQPGRIGDLAAVAEKKEVEIHIYDHHPPMPDDIKGDHEVLQLTGSTVAILTEIIKNTGLSMLCRVAVVSSKLFNRRCAGGNELRFRRVDIGDSPQIFAEPHAAGGLWRGNPSLGIACHALEFVRIS